MKWTEICHAELVHVLLNNYVWRSPSFKAAPMAYSLKRKPKTLSWPGEDVGFTTGAAGKYSSFAAMVGSHDALRVLIGIIFYSCRVYQGFGDGLHRTYVVQVWFTQGPSLFFLRRVHIGIL